MSRSLEHQRADFEIIERPPLEEEWLELRRPWWNASLAGCLLPDRDSRTGCKHPYVSLGDAVTEKMRDGFEVVDEDRQRLYRRGLKMEPYILAEAAEMTGLQISDEKLMYRRGPILSTPDGVGHDRAEGRPIGVECKSTRLYVGPVCPAYWRLQALAQMWTADWDRVIIPFLDATLEVQIFEIDRDDAAEDEISYMVRRAQELLDTIAFGEVPDGVELSAGNVTAIWPRDTGAAVELPPTVTKELKGYLEAHKRMKAAEEEKKGHRDQVAALLGPDGIGNIAGIEVASYKASKDVDKVDWKRLAAENPELVAKYTETVPGARRFNLKKAGLSAVLNMIGGVQDDSEVDW